MKKFVYLLMLLSALPMAVQAQSADADFAQRFGRLALDCVHRPYPNKIAHVLNSDADVQRPQALSPAFYGCYDWHSSVHGHWLLTRLARRFPDLAIAQEARAALAQSLTAENIQGEVAYLSGKGRKSFERPYGLAWLLQLCAELREWQDPQAQTWTQHLAPLEALAAERIQTWVPKLSHPIRIGEHSQTAFAFGLILDWAETAGDSTTTKILREASLSYYQADQACPMNYEPSGHDFLSPCLAEADLMRRIVSPEAYADWLEKFLPGIPEEGKPWLLPETVTDPSDPKLAHLDGLNLSRAWMLEGILSGLPAGDARRASLQQSAQAHTESGFTAVTGAHYEGGHWLGSFAMYLLSKRGLK